MTDADADSERDTDTPLPKGVRRETLFEVVAGWHTAGAADDAVLTAAVEDATGITDAVGRQTRFLESLGVLEADGQRHRLTAAGEPLAAALAAGREAEARRRIRYLLADWPLTERVVGLVRSNPTAEATLVTQVGALAGVDTDGSRARSGVRAFVETLSWAGLLDWTDRGYVPGPATSDGGEALSLSVELGLEVDAAELESLVRALRAGLLEGDEQQVSGVSELEARVERAADADTETTDSTDEV